MIKLYEAVRVGLITCNLLYVSAQNIFVPTSSFVVQQL